MEKKKNILFFPCGDFSFLFPLFSRYFPPVTTKDINMMDMEMNMKMVDFLFFAHFDAYSK
jgi:hypothetical protein